MFFVVRGGENVLVLVLTQNSKNCLGTVKDTREMSRVMCGKTRGVVEEEQRSKRSSHNISHS